MSRFTQVLSPFAKGSRQASRGIVSMPTPPRITRALEAEHARIDTTLRDLAQGVARGAPDVAERWRQVADDLARHLHLEETLLLSRLDGFDAGLAWELREDHDQLREWLYQLAPESGGGLTEPGRLERFAAVLGRHVDRETEILYRWADTLNDPELYRAIVDALLDDEVAGGGP